jgi:hypothetical protein
MTPIELLEGYRRRPGASVLGVVLAGLLAGGGTASGQEDPRAKQLETLRSTVQQLEKALQEVRAKLAEMERKDRAAAETNVPITKPASPTTTRSNSMIIAEQKIQLPPPPIPLDANGRSPIRDYDTFNDYQQAAPRPDNKPIDPALKGFIPIPGTKSMIRFGGSARLDAIYDFQDNGNPNQFVPSSIPAEGQAGADGGPRSTIQAKGTRISFEVRRPAGEEGTLRIFNENDFFNDSTSSSMSFRVRHFYGQAWNFLVGQTYSAFMDIDAWPDVLDYAGPNASINRRQAQIRYSPPIYDGVGKMHLLFSLEQPDSDLSTTATGLPAGAKTVTRAPDGVAGWRWEGDVGHLQITGLFRTIGYEVDNAPDDGVFGWGVNAAGAFNLFEADKLTWQVAYGEGMARYVNDLGSADLDAAPDSSGKLEAIPVFAATAGYTHQWAARFRSTASYGYVHADPKASLGAFAIENTHYVSANLVWHPTKSFRMGLEYLYGLKETQSGADGDGHRLNFVLRYDLIR